MQALTVLKKALAAWLLDFSVNSAFYLPVGLSILLLFVPTLAILGIGAWFHAVDAFPGSEILLPWAIGFSALVVLVGAIMTFCSIKFSAVPGSLLYRLTHVDRRRR
jgi:hypothetical protein